MARDSLDTVFRHLRRVLHQERARQLTDADLLASFVSTGDPAAFELLVWRHQRMVFAVCKRVLHDSHEAEDAFQATFLVLLRKARSIGKKESLASWLYQVAHRIACRASANSARRSRRQQCGIDLASAADHHAVNSDIDLWPVLDEEIQRLPAKYRGPVVLCYLEGKSYEEAAKELGWPKGTVSTRLTRARELLRQQLTKRGVTLSAATMVTTLAAQASASAPSKLVTATVSMATGSAAGAVSAKVAALSQGVVLAMLLTKIKICACALTTVAIVGAGSGWLWIDREQAVQGQTAAAPEAPKTIGDKLGPIADKWRAVQTFQVKFTDARIAVSPDGKRVAVGGRLPAEPMQIWDIETGLPLKLANNQIPLVGHLAYSPDSTKLAVCSSTAEPEQIWILEANSGKRIAKPTIGNGAEGKCWFAPDSKGLIAMMVKKESVQQLFYDNISPPQPLAYDAGFIKHWALPTDLWGGVLNLDLKLEGSIGRTSAISNDAKILAVEYLGKVETTDNISPAQLIKKQEILVVAAESGKIIQRFVPKLHSSGMPYELRALAFSPDAKHVVGAGWTEDGQGFAQCWDLTNRRSWSVASDTVINDVAFSPDGILLAGAGEDNTIRLWEAVTGKEIAVVRGHSGPVVRVLFTPDRRRMVTASEDGTVRIWEPGDEKIGSGQLKLKVKLERLSDYLGYNFNFLDTLISRLASSDRTNQQAIEALCLATLGRLPSEVEMAVMSKGVANSSDRRQALADVTLELIRTREFRAHAEALNNLAQHDLDALEKSKNSK
jgi:RNA polymerase sigma factor (sigma-70 family)